jgi:hypothetical protein
MQSTWGAKDGTNGQVQQAVEEVQPARHDGAAVGSILGSILGNVLGGDNPFTRVGASAVLGAFGKNLGEVIDRVGVNGDLSTSIDQAFFGTEVVGKDGATHTEGAFSDDLLASAKSAAIGAVSALLMSEFSHAIGLDHAGWVGELVSGTLNGVLTQVGSTAVDMALDTAAEGASLLDGLNVGSRANIGGGVAGSMLANELRLELDKPHPAELLSRLDKEIAEQGADLAGHTIHDAVMELSSPVNDNHTGHADRVFAVRNRAATFGYRLPGSTRFVITRRSA